MDPYRSLLFVPAHREGWAAKGAAAGADALILDLEDAVPPDAKSRARAMLPAAIQEAREARPGIGIVVRVNDWSSPEAPADYAAVAAQPVDAVMLPKLESVAELARAHAVFEYLERIQPARRPIEVVPILETARGVAGRDAIAGGPRVGAVLVSTTKDADISRSVGFTWTPSGLETLYLRSGVVIACRATAGCQPWVGVWQDIADLEGLEREARENQGLGFAGQAVIHPSHVEVVNRVYSPDPARVDYYRGLIAAYEEAVNEGRGAAVYQGEHIDQAHLATARVMVAWADRIRSSG